MARMCLPITPPPPRTRSAHLIFAFKSIQCNGQEECKQDELAHYNPRQPEHAAGIVGGADHGVHADLEVLQVQDLQHNATFVEPVG